MSIVHGATDPVADEVWQWRLAMQGARLGAFVVVIVLTAAGSLVVPYVLLFVRQHQERASCTAVVVFVIAGAFLGLLLGLSLRRAVEARVAVPAIQRAIDEQCGDGLVRVDVGHFVRSPYYSWITDDASCHFIDGSRTRECYCLYGGE
jgi:hypothetical protein